MKMTLHLQRVRFNSFRYMDDFETLTILSKLPPRVRDESVPCTTDFTATVIENYVREFVEPIEPFAHDDAILEPVLEALYNNRVTCPVRLADLKQVKLSAAVRAIPRIYARLLVTLNGPMSLITPSQLREAANRERALRTTEHGWGSCEAHEHLGYTSKLLLLSVGVAEELLPSIKSVPSLVKSNIDMAFKKACLFFGW